MKQDNQNNLTDKQKAFAELFAYGTTRGNGTMSYVEAYGIDLSVKGQYNVARNGAAQNLTKSNILDYIRSLYDTVLNDEIIDNELTFLIMQSADFRTKLGAIKEYNQLRQRITKKIEKVNILDYEVPVRTISEIMAMESEEE